VSKIKVLPENKNYVRHIQLLRGIAVISVVLFHMNPSQFKNGHLGVNSFFVISGFVILPSILKITNGQNFSGKMRLLQSFYVRRFFRLAPTLSVTIVLSTVAIVLLCPTWIFTRLVQQGIASILLLGNIGAYRYSGGSYFDINPNPLIHLWSLSAEEQIYLFVPILFLALFTVVKSRKIVNPKSILLTLLILGYLSQYYFFSPILVSFGIRNPEGLIFYLPTSHIWEFAAGGLVSLMGIQTSRFFRRNEMQIVGIMCFLGLVLIMFSNFDLNQKPLIITLLTSITIASRTIDLYSQKINDAVLYIGDRSYSAYLCHMPIIYIFHYSPYLEILNKPLAYILTILSMLFVTRFLYNNFEARYRIRSTHSKSTLKLPFKHFVIFNVLPLIFLLVALYWVTQVKWVFNKSDRPTYAVGTDVKCDRLTSGQPCWYPLADSTGINMLIGDSVSAAYIDTFVTKSHTDGKNAVTMTLAGCQFVTRNTAAGSEYTLLSQEFNKKLALNKQTCFDHNEDIVQFIYQNKPEKVFLSQHIVNNGYSNLGISKIDLRDLRVENIIELAKITEELIVIGASPLLRSDQIVASQTLFKVFGDTSSIRVANLDPDFISDDEYMRKSLEKHRVNYFSLKPIFCEQLYCKVFENGWLYIDTSHISTLGAKKLLNIF